MSNDDAKIGDVTGIPGSRQRDVAEVHINPVGDFDDRQAGILCACRQAARQCESNHNGERGTAPLIKDTFQQYGGKTTDHI
ncbi:hypothetical protein [Rhodopila globiformis]|uniref:hypothetical protein n=1 Tax=Rhodopila globiformis TaxID=1071 RepID=UPI001EFEBDE9|nr:hypothetical protein [Rhodopila globiformis]